MPSSESAHNLEQQITVARATMIRSHYFDEAGWLARMDSAPDSCGTTMARESLRRVSSLARELGFTLVSEWIDDFLDAD